MMMMDHHDVGCHEDDTHTITALARLISNRPQQHLWFTTENGDNDDGLPLIPHHHHNDEEDDWNAVTATTIHNNNDTFDRFQQRRTTTTIRRSSSIGRIERWNCQQRSNFRIILGGTCVVLFGSFVWSSYSSNTWYQTVLRIQITTLSSLGNTAMTRSIQSHNLLSFLQQFWSNPYQSLNIRIMCIMVMVATTVVVPCVTMVYLSIQMMMMTTPCRTIPHPPTSMRFPNDDHYGDRSDIRHPHDQWSSYEIMIRSSFLIIYIITIIMVISNHSLTIRSSDSNTSNNDMDDHSTILSFNTAIADGLISYTIGISFAMIGTVMLRYWTIVQSRMLLPQDDHTTTMMTIRHDQSPPLSSHHANRIDEHGSFPPLMQILEEQAAAAAAPPPDHGEIPDHRRANMGQQPQDEASSLPQWKILLVFQCGLLCILLIVPSFYWPMFQWKHWDPSGIVPEEESHFVSGYQVPSLMWRAAVGTPSVLGLLGSFHVCTTVLFPFYAIVVASMTWMIAPTSSSLSPAEKGNRMTRDSCRDHLYMIHPVIGSMVASVSILFSASIFQHWYLLPGVLWYSPTMPYVSISLSVGAWCYVFHSILLEILILATLKWS